MEPQATPTNLLIAYPLNMLMLYVCLHAKFEWKLRSSPILSNHYHDGEAILHDILYSTAIALHWSTCMHPALESSEAERQTSFEG